MNCHDVMDTIYEFEGTETLPVITQIRIQFHILHCSRCAAEVDKLETARSLMRESFFPPHPELEDRIMQSIDLEEQQEALHEAAGVSFRSWVITGLIILVSLATSFLGMDFIKVADDWGSSFLLPVGITIGAVGTAYGALFIGSHIKELSNRFNLH